MNPPSEQERQLFNETWSSHPGLVGWLAEVNNRPIGVRYMVTSLAFFLAGVMMAMVMRTQLAVPDHHLLTPDAYNRVFTMHGSTMLYLFAVPFLEGLGLYMVPLLIGSRDAAFPRMTGFGYWMYLFGGLVMYASVLFGHAPDAAWTAYTPMSGTRFSGPGLDFWLLGLSMVEVAGIGAAVEIIVTILKFRAPGMAIHMMPLFAWAYLTVGFMIIFGFTPLLLATLMLEMERSFGFVFFEPHLGGSSLLWQHLFWFFGHPEVYIIFLPATGALSMIIPVLARRRIVAYKLLIVAFLVTGFVSFGLWTHHMFAAGLPDLPMLFFAAASFMVALASGTQVFAWIATLWGSRPPFNVPMLFILGFFFIFINGGMTGVMVATMPFDWQVHETNFVVAHFHHVLIGGAVFPYLAAIYYWMPKFSGRIAGENWGRIGFALIFVGFNVTFLAMYIIGLLGMRRRVFTYPVELGVGDLNFLSTIGSYALGAGFTIILIGFLWGAWRGRPAGDDPWGGGTLEWSITSPPHSSGFPRPPVVRDRYPLWYEAPRDEMQDSLERVGNGLDNRPSRWRATLVTDVTNALPQAIQHLSGPTLLHFVTAAVMLVGAVAILVKSYILAAVAGVFVVGLFGKWLYDEPSLDQGEAGDLTEELKLPAFSSGTKAVGWWGMLGMIAILFTVLTALIYSYFYLRLYSDQWPQMGLPLPELTRPILAYTILAAGGLVHVFDVWARIRNRRRNLILGTAAVLILGVAFSAMELWNLFSLPFRPSANAYASIVFMLNGLIVVMVLTASSFIGGGMLRILRLKEPFDTARLQLWLQTSELFWFFSVASGLAVFLTTYASPHLP